MKFPKLHELVHRYWQCFISLKLTFLLLGVISLGAILGMSFDQNKTFDEFYVQLSQGGISGWFLSFFELYDAFHSWWFSLAIFLLALNLIACSIERLPRIYFDFIRPRPYLTSRRRMGLKLCAHSFYNSLPDAHAAVSKFMSADYKKVRLSNGEYFFNERHRFGRFGVYVVHIALLIVMFSSIYTTQNGVDGHMLIEEGQTSPVVNARGPSGVPYDFDLGFEVGCSDFRLRTFVDNSPMEFESDLYIKDNNHIVTKKTVRVNEPLSYQGFTFYQSSYRPIISERVVELLIKGDGYEKRIRTKLNTAFTLPSKEQLRVEKIYEDFAGLGQAAKIAKISPNNKDTYFHIFRRYQDYDQIVRSDLFSVALVDIDQHYATGLSVGKVPGVSVIFGGFLLLLVGLYLCFFMNPMRFFACIEKKDDGFLVWFAAQGFRHHHLVQEIYDQRIAKKGKD